MSPWDSWRLKALDKLWQLKKGISSLVLLPSSLLIVCLLPWSTAGIWQNIADHRATCHNFLPITCRYNSSANSSRCPLNMPLFVLLRFRIRWKCAQGRMSLRVFCLPFATSMRWWQRGGNLVLKVGTDHTPLTPETSPFLSTSSTTIWRQIQRYTCFFIKPAVCYLNWKSEHGWPQLNTKGHFPAKQHPRAL